MGSTSLITAHAVPAGATRRRSFVIVALAATTILLTPHAASAQPALAGGESAAPAAERDAIAEIVGWFGGEFGVPCSSSDCGPGNLKPVANAGPDMTGYAGHPVLFSAKASTDADGCVEQSGWTFGDGAYADYAQTLSVAHTYANTGTYTVKLWVKDNCGTVSGSDTLIISIINGDPPDPCDNNASPVAQLSGPASGDVGQVLTFSAAASSDSDGQITNFLFDYGNGQTSSGASSVRSYAYPSAGSFIVRVTATDNCGASASRTVSVVIAPADPCAGNQAPVAQLSAPSSGDVNQSLSFSAAASSDADGSISNYYFDFGDGQTASGASSSRSHAYASAGSYTARVTVTDNCGATASVSRSVTINEPSGGGPTFDPRLLGFARGLGEMAELQFTPDGEHIVVASRHYGLVIVKPNWGDIANSQIVGVLDVPGESQTFAMRGNVAVAVSSYNAARVIDLSDLSAPRLLSTIPVACSTAAIVEDHVYLANSMGLYVYSIADASQPVFVCERPWPATGLVATSDGNWLYASQISGTMLVVDTSSPALPMLSRQVTLAGPARSICLDESRSTCLVAVSGAGIQLFDVGNPAIPALRSTLALPDVAIGATISGADAVVRGMSQIMLVNAQSPSSPIMTASVSLGAGGIAVDAGRVLATVGHRAEAYIASSGALQWNGRLLDGNGTRGAIARDGDLIVVATSTAGSQVLREIGSAVELTATLPVAAYDVAMVGGFAYFAGATGLTVADLSDPSAPELALALSGIKRGIALHPTQSIGYVASGTTGIQVVSLLNRATPELVRTIDTPGNAYGVAASGNLLVVADYASGFRVYDISDPSNPIFRSATVLPAGAALQVAIDATKLFVRSQGAVYLYNVADAVHPTLQDSLPVSCVNISVHQDRLYASCSASGVEIYSIASWQMTIEQVLPAVVDAASAAVECAGQLLVADTVSPLAVFDLYAD